MHNQVTIGDRIERMSLEARNQSLYSLIRSQAIDTLKILEHAINEGAQVVHFQQGVWQKDAQQEQTYTRQQINKPEYWILFHQNEHTIQALPSFQQACEAVRSDAIWGKHMDTLVGSASGATRIDLNGLLNSFAHQSLMFNNSFVLSETSFNDLIDTYEQFFSSDKVTYVRYTPVYGISISERMSISDNIAIGPLEEEEIIESMDMGLITSNFFGMATDFIHNPPQAAIFSYFSLPKVIGESNPEQTQSNLKSFTDVWNQLSVDITTLLDILTLILESPVTPLGSITKSVHGRDGARQIQKNSVVNAWAIPNKEFTTESQQRLHTLWPIIYGSTRKSRHFLAIGIRRYALAMSRPSLDDRLIDLMISAESIFLDTNKNELTFRLSHRVALLLGSTSEEQKELFKFMKDAYGMRSKVVHGSKSYVNDPHDAEELSQTINRLSEIMRRSLLLMLDKALNPHAPKELIDWTELMFPVAAPTSVARE